MSELSTSIAAIVVTYDPDLEHLNTLLVELTMQCDHVIVVDNGSNFDLTVGTAFQLPNVKWLMLDDNKGIATAHNAGVAQARKLNSTHVLLMDQDSLPTSDMVDVLLTTYDMLIRQGKKVAAVGPLLVNSDNNTRAAFIKSGKYKVHKCYQEGTVNRWCEADFVISSGALISLRALGDIGLMDDALFIDCVDIEWGFRALSKGYQCFGAYDARMEHSVGEEPLELLGGRVLITMHDPLRHYYYYRNVVTLFMRPYPKAAWKAHVLLKALLQSLIFSTLSDKPAQHAAMIVKGVYHGLRNKLGKYEA